MRCESQAKLQCPLIDCKAPLWEDDQLPANIHWPHPRSETRTVMYEDDPDRDDFVKFICTADCCIEYHAKCWNKLQKVQQHMRKDAAIKAEVLLVYQSFRVCGHACDFHGCHTCRWLFLVQKSHFLWPTIGP